MPAETDLYPVDGLVRHRLNGPTMGARYSATFFALPDWARESLAGELFAVVDKVDRQMSLWKPESDLCRLNRARLGEWVDLPRELLRVLFTALDIERQSNGAFDIGVGAAVEAWGFGTDDKPPNPKNAAILGATARPRTAQSLELDLSNGRARKHAALALDLNGIAKGFAVDEMAAIMRQSAIGDWLVSLDGEIRARGRKPNGRPWSIAIERPTRGLREPMRIVELTDCAIATSGDYRHWIERDGRILSHTIDPQTNAPACNGLASVSVLCGNCMRADAWATALMVLGPEQGPRIAGALGLRALFIVRDGAKLREIAVAPPQIVTAKSTGDPLLTRQAARPF